MPTTRRLCSRYTKPLALLAALCSSLSSAAEPPPTDEELTPFFHRMVTYHSRMDASVPDQAVIFIGDSITQALAVSAVTAHGVNYGIGGDTTRGVLTRIPVYNSLKRAQAIVLAIGVNDLKHRDNEVIQNNHRAILEALPQHVPVIVSAVLPVDSRIETMHSRKPRILDINKQLEKTAGSFGQAVFLDPHNKLVDADGNLKEIYHIGDGLHLNQAGYAVWIESLREALKGVE